MLNVNEETVRRWIRDGKLNAKRGIGRGGSTILLEDIVAFANKPPRAYLLALETWLTANGFSYQKIEDSKEDKSGENASPSTAPTVTEQRLASARMAGIAVSSLIPIVGPMVVAGAATAELMKRRNYRSYSIQLINQDEKDTKKSNLPLPQELVINDCTDGEDPKGSIDAPQSEVPENTVSVTDILEKISHAKKLLDAEIITQDEFTEIKARLIAKI